MKSKLICKRSHSDDLAVSLYEPTQVNLVSSSFEELFGYSREELTGKSILRLLSLTGASKSSHQSLKMSLQKLFT